MLSNKKFQIAISIGESVAISHFVMMLNPKFRVPKFVWNDLYSIVSKMTICQIGLAGNFGKDQKAMEKIAVEHSKYRLDLLFKDSDVKNWLKLNE